jgi:hypothetical protein
MSPRARLGEDATKRVMPKSVVDRFADQGDEADAEPCRQSIYMTKGLLRRAKSLGKRRGLSISTVVKLALEQYLGEHEV